MASTLRTIRIVLSLAALAVSAGMIAVPPKLTAEEAEAGCEFGEPTGDFRCRKDKRHIYAGICEGVDCYYILETCCAKP